MWYLELYCYTYNLTGIVFCVLLVTFVLGTIACLNDQFLKCKKRWQQILVILAFVEAAFATIFFAYPKVSLNSDNAINLDNAIIVDNTIILDNAMTLDNTITFAGFGIALVMILFYSIITFCLGMLFAELIKWVFTRA